MRSPPRAASGTDQKAARSVLESAPWRQGRRVAAATRCGPGPRRTDTHSFILSEVVSLFEQGAPVPATKIGMFDAVIRLLEERPEHNNELQVAPLSGRQADYLGRSRRSVADMAHVLGESHWTGHGRGFLRGADGDVPLTVRPADPRSRAPASRARRGHRPSNRGMDRDSCGRRFPGARRRDILSGIADHAFTAWANTATAMDIHSRRTDPMNRSTYAFCHVFSATGLQRLMNLYCACYVGWRTDRSLHKAAPIPRAIAPPSEGSVLARAQVVTRATDRHTFPQASRTLPDPARDRVFGKHRCDRHGRDSVMRLNSPCAHHVRPAVTVMRGVRW